MPLVQAIHLLNLTKTNKCAVQLYYLIKYASQNVY